MGCVKNSDTAAITSDLLDPDGRFVSSKAGGGNNPGPVQNGGTGGGGGSDRLSPPRTPVIFVLGGPGSGKITHCDRAVQERQGLSHINMTDLIQQHIVGNQLSDFSSIPPSNLIEVLQMEIKMSVNARGYVISGYPRSMRDVVEYQNKLQRIDQVILLNWHVRILEKQIEYGSQLGETVLQLARMELKNYAKNVLAVAEYFDQLDKLTVVDGERQPTEVYEDFLAAIDSTMAKAGTTNNHKAPISKRSTMEGPMTEVPTPIIPNGVPAAMKRPNVSSSPSGQKVIWIIGGPGSNKSLLSSTGVKLHFSSAWEWFSIGQELRRLVTPGGGNNKGSVPGIGPYEIQAIKTSLNKGELVRDDVVMTLIAELMGRSKKKNVVLDGFPRNLQQLEQFRTQFPHISPPPSCILVDCSEVELGRSLGHRANTSRGNQGREDDQNSSAVKRRLELYRTVTLPTLKMLDDQHRLHIIDGDLEDKARIVEEFNDSLGQLIDSLHNPNDPKHKLGVVLKKESRKPSTDTINGMYNEVQQNSE